MQAEARREVRIPGETPRPGGRGRRSSRAALLLLALAATLIARDARAQEDEGEVELAELALYQEEILRGRASSIRGDLEDYLFDFPDSVRARLLMADVHERRGEHARALGLVEELAEAALAQGLGEAWARRAFDLHFVRGRYEEAVAALDRAAEPRAVSLASRRVLALAATGRREEAREQLGALPAVSMDESGDPAALLEHARAYESLGIVQPGDRCAVYAEALFRTARDPRQAEALRLLGDFYRRARFEDGLPALKAYHDALEIDRTRVLCHVGTARVHIYRMQFDKAEAAVRAALSLQPEHPEALAVQAELLLFDRKFSEGRELAEKALSLNPRNLSALSCRAAADWLLSAEGREDSLQAILDVDPHHADGFRLVADLVSYHYRFAEAIPLYRRGVEADPGHSTTYVGLARSLANTGQGEEALEALRTFRSIDRDRYPLAKNLRKSLEAVESFVVVERGPFDFHLHAGDGPVLAPLIWQLYEKAWSELCQRYGLDPDRRIRVEIFHEHDDFSARSVGFTGFGALGVCFGDTLTIVSPSSELRGSFHWERTAVHELVHTVSLALSNQRVPRWLTEGMSVYEERVFAPYCDREMERELVDFYHSGEILPVRHFNRVFEGPNIMFGYYQGGLLCEFLVEQYGNDVLASMLRGYAQDWETPEVVERVLSMSPEELDDRFLDWLWSTRVSKMKVQPTYTPEGRRRLLDRVEASEDPAVEDLVQVAWAYHRARRRVDRDDYLARAREKDAERPSLKFLLAEMALEDGGEDRALQLLREGVEAGGEEFWAFQRLGELTLRREEPEEALEWFARAKQCFPRYVGHGNPYVLRAQILGEMGRDEEVLEELRQYCGIHESDASPRWTLVRAALDRDDHAEAEKYLLELRAIDPFLRHLHRDLARCQIETGKPSQAEQSLRLALAVAPQDDPHFDPGLPAGVVQSRDRSERADLHLDLYELYLSLGEVEKAKAEWDRAKELDPENGRLSEGGEGR